MTKKIETLQCICCGKEKAIDKFRRENNIIGYSTQCIQCENKRLKRLQEANGSHLGLFYACLTFNVPLDPNAAQEIDFVNETNGWNKYLEKINQKDNEIETKKIKTFFDGISNIFAIFGKEMSEKDFSKYCMYEQSRLAKLQGTEEQREKWGTNPLYTNEVYNELDRQYENRVISYKGTTITPQMEDTLIKICKWNWQIDIYIKDNNIKAAKDLQTMVETALASESMRKKDEKPVEALRTDALVDALEKAGCMENGELLNYDELIVAMRDKFVKSKKYDYSLDVADQIILDNYNNLRMNSEMAIVSTLPEDMIPEDEYGEFEPQETEEEKQNKKFAGIAPLISFNKNEQGKD